MRSPQNSRKGKKLELIVTDRPVGCKCRVEHLRGPRVSKQFWGESRASYQGIASAMPPALKIRAPSGAGTRARQGRARPPVPHEQVLHPRPIRIKIGRAHV